MGMFDIQFGDKIINAQDDQKDHWLELASAPTNKLFIDILENQYSEKLSDLLRFLEENNAPKCQEANGYMKAIKDIVEFLSVNIPESTRDINK